MVQLLDTEDRIMAINVSGQSSERNLVDAVNKYKNFTITLDGKTHVIKSAKQLGGGSPEPKADIALITTSGISIGISMKKPNFGFFENWMDEEKLRKLLSSVGMTKKQSDIIVKALKNKLTKIMSDSKFRLIVMAEYKAMIESSRFDDSLFKTGKKFRADDLNISSTERANICKVLPKRKDRMFGSSNNSPTSKYKVENIYAPLQELLGSGYVSFLKTVIGGDSTNPYPAEFIIIKTISAKISKADLIDTIESAESVEQTVKKYVNDPEVNLKFRLRPITITRAAYSQTNLGKYKKGLKFYSDMSLGISWTVFVTK